MSEIGLYRLNVHAHVRERTSACVCTSVSVVVPLQQRDVSPLCLVRVNVCMTSQAWSCDRSAPPTSTSFHPASSPLPPHPSILCFSTGILFTPLSGSHLWHMEFSFNSRSEPVRHWQSHSRRRPAGQRQCGSGCQGGYLCTTGTSQASPPPPPPWLRAWNGTYCTVCSM